MNRIGKTENALVLRTDFKNQKEWEKLCDEILTPDPEEGFISYVTFLSDQQYSDIPVKTVISLVDPKEHWFIFVVDKVTLNSPDHPILCIDFIENPGNVFRVTPSALWSVENNLSICNMDFSEFADNVDSLGVFRGFGEPTT